jgi:hypothetical protein
MVGISSHYRERVAYADTGAFLRGTPGHRNQCGIELQAARVHHETARVEAAPSRDPGRIRGLAGQDLSLVAHMYASRIAELGSTDELYHAPA